MPINLRNFISRAWWKKRVESLITYAVNPSGIQLFFLLIGLILAGATSYCGPKMGKLTTGGEMLEYDLYLDSTKPTAISDYLNVENYSSMSVFTETAAPERATVILYGARNQGNMAEVRRIVSGPSWSKWEEGISYSSMRLVVERASEAHLPPLARETATFIVQPVNKLPPAGQQPSPKETTSPTATPTPTSPSPTSTATPQAGSTPVTSPPEIEILNPSPTLAPKSQDNAAPGQTHVKVIIFLKPKMAAAPSTNSNR